MEVVPASEEFLNSKVSSLIVVANRANIKSPREPKPSKMTLDCCSLVRHRASQIEEDTMFPSRC